MGFGASRTLTFLAPNHKIQGILIFASDLKISANARRSCFTILCWETRPLRKLNRFNIGL